MSLLRFIYSQLFVNLPYPEGSYEGKTVIVTGSNVGLGKEAARHFARLGTSTLILAVRNIEKGEAAKKEIEQSTGCDGDVIKVWQLDLSNYSSVRSFAAKVNKELKRVDIAILNAAIATYKYRTAEDNEETITVNVVSTFLLALLLLPTLKQTAQKFNTRPTMSITSSEVHGFTPFKEKSAPEGQIFTTLNGKETADMNDRYQVSKLLEIFALRAMVERRPASDIPVTINCMNPGFCHSELTREGHWRFALLKALLARSTEQGSRTLIHAVSQGPETHGQYLSDCKIEDPAPLVLSEEGKKAQVRVWDELVQKLEAIQPGVTSNL
ncbi:short-chain dehydrogenase [Polychaeton citri CBS 116435]|uniref:Short-chain dehydrogenase n=1 Tax=Polychaeton citri CBS 116435 TaxID=1314669 RepID=A0A9P4QER9_9PEZI|nr:short-chain dehydrogenase [Polychaeton citri CBS 116435]